MQYKLKLYWFSDLSLQNSIDVERRIRHDLPRQEVKEVCFFCLNEKVISYKWWVSHLAYVFISGYMFTVWHWARGEYLLLAHYFQSDRQTHIVVPLENGCLYAQQWSSTTAWCLKIINTYLESLPLTIAMCSAYFSHFEEYLIFWEHTGYPILLLWSCML